MAVGDGSIFRAPEVKLILALAYGSISKVHGVSSLNTFIISARF